jgi:DinB family protein
VNAIELLIQQLDTVNIRLHHSADDLEPEELAARPVPGANPIGFILWHMARSQDWAVNTAIRDEPEVIWGDRWRNTTIAVPGIGTGFDSLEADRVARMVDREALLAYADAVHAEITRWLRTQDESLLDAIPDAEAHDAPYPEYQTPGFRTEMSSGPEHDDAVGRRGGLPAWIYLTSVAVTHLHRHLGEIDLLKDLLRSGA